MTTQTYADRPLRITSRWAQLDPAPTRDIPVLIGGGGEKKTLKMVAQHATTWHGFGDVDVLTHKHEVLDRWCAEVERNPAEIERSAAASEGPDFQGEGLTGVGTRLFTVSVDGRAGYDLGGVRDRLAFRDEFNAR